MKNNFLKILLLILSLSLAFCLFGCSVETPDGESGDNEDEVNKPAEPDEGGSSDTIDWENVPLDGLVLIYNNKARFQVVYTVEGGSAAVRAAEELVATLRELGVEVADAVSDKDAADVKDCEIIIGTGARHRGDEVNVGQRYLGAKGYTVRTVGTRIVIAGGSASLTKGLYNDFVENQLGIGKKTTELPEVAIAEDYGIEQLTEYTIPSISVAGVDLSEYTLIIDVEGASNFAFDEIREFPEMLYSVSGYWLDVGTVENAASYEHKFIIRYTENMKEEYREDGFAAYVDANGDFIIECSYANAFDATYNEFMTSAVFNKMKAINFAATYKYTKCVSKVYYSQFGAVGDGETDDYRAMYDAHVYANQCGQTVYADEGKNYYVHVFEHGSIPVKTDVYLGDAKITIDDTGSKVYAQRGNALFRLDKDNPMVVYNESQIQQLFGDVSLTRGQTEIPWLVDYIVAESMIRFTNAYHKDYVRNGGNLDSGYNRTDAIVVGVDGRVDPNTELVFDFDQITEIRIIRTDDAPITFDGGKFDTICCTTVAETEFKNKYDAYGRGIQVYRANSTVKNVTHRMLSEPYLDTTNSKWGEQNESYPYHAFLVYDQTYNSKAVDMDLTGHTTYYESKDTSSNPVSMGSYDFVIGYSIGVEFNGVEQNGVEITDERYWGIMASNGVKNIKFVDCYISRFDAHRGFWNGELTDVTLGHSFNVIGGGLLKATRVTKMTGYYFIHLRGDYGAVFEGDMELVDCELLGYKSYDSNQGGAFSTAIQYTGAQIVSSGYAYDSDVDAYNEYLNWDFGYTCYMPKTMLIDNFTTKIPYVQVFSDLNDEVFSEDIANTYVITNKITFRNMHNIDITYNPTRYTKLAAIPVVNETYPEESTAAD